MSVLTLSQISVNYDRKSVLTDVSLAVSPAEIVSLLGPNGAGKTTLLRAIMGTVRYRGQIQRPAHIGYVPQLTEAVLDYPLSVAQIAMHGRFGQLGWFRRPRANDRQAVAEALARVSLSDLANRPIGQLSGGQLQRALIARALAANPELLLLDEPFTGLDQPSQDLLTELFLALKADGTALLMSTHDLGHAVDVSDSLVLLNQTVIAHGAPAKLRHQQPWLDTFQVGSSSPLLRTVGCA